MPLDPGREAETRASLWVQWQPGQHSKLWVCQGSEWGPILQKETDWVGPPAIPALRRVKQEGARVQDQPELHSKNSISEFKGGREAKDLHPPSLGTSLPLFLLVLPFLSNCDLEDHQNLTSCYKQYINVALKPESKQRYKIESSLTVYILKTTAINSFSLIL